VIVIVIGQLGWAVVSTVQAYATPRSATNRAIKFGRIALISLSARC
jgi:hypothetical protein